jgi:putrescine transport system substrate-binding protein
MKARAARFEVTRSMLHPRRRVSIGRMKHSVAPALRCLALAAVLAVSACASTLTTTSSSTPTDTLVPELLAHNPDPDNVVVVYNWSDYMDPLVIHDFTRLTGVRVIVEVMDSNGLLETKLITGPTGFDVIVPSGSFLARHIKYGFLQKLDKSLLPNLVHADPAFTRMLEAFDPGLQYSVNYMWGTTGIGYNVQAIQARMPDAPTDSVAMLWNPQVVKKFADCGVSVVDEPTEVLASALLYLGKDPNSENPDDLAAAEKVMSAVRPYIRMIHSSEYIEALASGEICLALGWSSDVVMAAARAEEAGKSHAIVYRLPKEGAFVFLDQFAIPKDAKHVKNAHLFIDYMLRPEVAAKNSNFTSFANSNADAWPLVNPAIQRNPNIFPTPDAVRRLAPDLPESTKFSRALQETFARFRKEPAAER